jgi:hypothetical protein
METEQINQILKGLNEVEKERLILNGYNNECFFKENGEQQEEYTFKAIDKKTYIYFDCGSSGVFMFDKRNNTFYGIKAYGVRNILKPYINELLNINPFEFGKWLHNKRWDYRR